MRILDIPMSGRRGDYVFYMRGGKLFRRRFVVPRNVRTAQRRRTRGAFGVIAKAWSGRLTEPQRQAWMAAAKTVKSHPRLWQCGPLFGEMLFQSLNNARARVGREMLLWPTERVVFPPNPVTGLSLTDVNGRPRLRLRVTGPVTEDIMVFGQPPCSARRKKWRHGAYLGLLPAPVAGECDITDLYVRRYGQPEPGQRIFIRTHQQKDGWEGRDYDLSEVVPATVMAPARPGEGEVRNPRVEGRKKAEGRRGKAGCLGGVAGSDGCFHDCGWAGVENRGRIGDWGLAGLRGADEGALPGRLRNPGLSPSLPERCTMHTGQGAYQYQTLSSAVPVQRPRGTGLRRGIRALERHWHPGLRAEACRKGRCRELWRGG